MADININARVKAVIEGKSYDLRPSGNPHQKLPKSVVKYLEDNGLLADAVPAAPAGAGASDLARMQAEIDKLTTALATAEGERDAAKTAQQEAEQKLSEAQAEIEKLTKK